MTIKSPYQGLTATPQKGMLTKNLVGAFLMLTLSTLMIASILVPELSKLISQAKISNDFLDWVTVLGGYVIVGFLIVFPIVLIVQGFVYYQEANALDRIGIVTKGYIMDKWIDKSEQRPIYHVRYHYLLRMVSLQTVSKELFQRLTHGQDVSVICLEDAPHISRLANSDGRISIQQSQGNTKLPAQ